MKLPKINLDELERIKHENFKDRLEFLDQYAEWVKKSSNKKWSFQQKAIID